MPEIRFEVCDNFCFNYVTFSSHTNSDPLYISAWIIFLFSSPWCFYFYSKMLRSLQTSKSSTSTWSCLLVPAVAMIKGTSWTHCLLLVFPLCSLACLCLTHASALWLSLHYWRCCLIAWNSSHYPRASMQTQFRLTASEKSEYQFFFSSKMWPLSCGHKMIIHLF